mmetsp:Transcript_24517/g.65847  ORF Transcript_24517/g.65847 Transcript_24517/m.65847 type:complete len:203 (+) Transcript_24517:679-1287(+)
MPRSQGSEGADAQPDQGGRARQLLPRHRRRCQRCGDDQGRAHRGGHHRQGGHGSGQQLRFCHRPIPLPSLAAAGTWPVRLPADGLLLSVHVLQEHTDRRCDVHLLALRYGIGNPPLHRLLPGGALHLLHIAAHHHLCDQRHGRTKEDCCRRAGPLYGWHRAALLHALCVRLLCCGGHLCIARVRIRANVLLWLAGRLARLLG